MASYRYERASTDFSNSPTDEESYNTPSESGMTRYPPTGSASRDASVLHGDESTDEKDKYSGSARSESRSKSNTDKEKRKRSRVTPEQLVHLEQYFSTDRSPPIAKRREISELLGMQERQTQIWFQNRRAKAKLQDGKQNQQKAQRDSVEVAPEASPGLSVASEVDLCNLIHEDEPVTIIPCSDLTIGTWRRVASSTDTDDLVAYICETKRCLTWFIHSGGYGFKMDIAFDIVLNTEFSKIGPNTGLATFILSQAPNFYIENVTSPLPDGSIPRTWKRCADWTEGRQASQVLRHTIVGSDAELGYVLRNLQAHASISEVRSREATYRSERMAPSTMELPPPPLASLATAGFAHSGIPIKHPQYMDQSRKRPSYDGQYAPFPLDTVDMGPVPHSAPAAPYYQNEFTRQANAAQPHFASAVYNAGGASHHSYEGSRLPHGYPANHISRGQPPSTYAAQAESYSHPRALQPFQRETASLSPLVLYPTPSPPLLTTPYNPGSHSERLYNNSNRSSPGEMSGMPRIMHEADEDFRYRRSH